MGRTRSTNRGLILLLQIITPYIQQQLKKLWDNPNWYDDMLISWDKNPRNQREAIYNYLSHVQLNGLLEIFTFIDGDMKPAFYFEIPRYNHNRYNITTMNILYHIIRIILSVGTILILIRNEDIYQAHKHTHPTNKIRYIISQLLTLIIYTIALITLSHISRYLE